MNILIVNDDSIYATGIELLARAAKQIGKIWVVAPAEQCSAMSHKITIWGNLHIEKVDNFPVEVEGAFKVEGSPADCVKVAINYILPEKPDFVFSGVNNGFNMGYEIAYSGTMAAAVESLMNGVPAIAFSSAYNLPMTLAENYIVNIAAELTQLEPSLKYVWNVNFPAADDNMAKGILYDRTVAPNWLYGHYYTETKQEDGSVSLEIHGTPITDPNDVPSGTDIEAILKGYISISKVYSAVL